MKTWNIDPMHSEIAFKVKHLMISTVRGTFGAFEGSMTAADDTFQDANMNFSAEVASVNTQNEKRDAHLQGADFFDTEKFPQLTFVSTKVTKPEANELLVVGDLTMKGVTKSVELHGTIGGVATDMYGARVAAFEFLGTINRQDFGLTWNAALETGGVVVSDAVTLMITIEAKEA